MAPSLDRARWRPILRHVCPPEIDDDGAIDETLDILALLLASMPAAARAMIRGSVNLLAVGGRFGVTRGDAALLRPLRELVIVAYFERPSIKAGLGYDPDPWTAAMVDRRARWAEAVTRHRELLITRHERPPLAP